MSDSLYLEQQKRQKKYEALKIQNYLWSPIRCAKPDRLTIVGRMFRVVGAGVSCTISL